MKLEYEIDKGCIRLSENGNHMGTIWGNVFKPQDESAQQNNIIHIMSRYDNDLLAVLWHITERIKEVKQ